MMKKILIGLSLLFAFGSGAVIAITVQTPNTAGYLLERDGEVAKNEPGPHDGGGPSTGYVFFEKAPNLKLGITNHAAIGAEPLAGRFSSREESRNPFAACMFDLGLFALQF